MTRAMVLDMSFPSPLANGWIQIVDTDEWVVSGLNPMYKNSIKVEAIEN